jgi:hypothetical protein
MPDIWYLLAGMSGFILTGVLFAYISVFISDVVEVFKMSSSIIKLMLD